jgi:oxygen-independent coproporphyrinogen-3 oxidase
MDRRCEQPVPSLYVHVPFCARKCLYCAFYSEVAAAGLVERCLAALIRELEMVADGLHPATIYFGGGTPSLLTVRQWERLIQAMDRLGLRKAVEWTIECNPATVTPDKGRLWRQAGVNRLSLGVQSLDEALLERLGRVHRREEVFQTFDLLRHLGFDNLNVDLMFAIPGQTREAWRRTLAEALALQSEHLSSYELTYEEDTVFFEQWQAGRLEADEDLACDMYEELVTRAAAHGLIRYEVSNFARHLRGPAAEAPSLACRHNIHYWRGGAFVGLGPSATSYVGGVRTRNVADTARYCEDLERGARPIAAREQLSPLARAGETAAFGLRLAAGWSWKVFEEVTGLDLRRHWAAEIEKLVACGWARADEDRLQLTSEGLRFADAAAQEFLQVEPAENR